MPRRHAVWLFVAATACGPRVNFAPPRAPTPRTLASIEATPTPPPVPSPPRLAGEVVARSNAWLHTEPDGARRFRLRAVDAPVAAHHVRRFEVVEDRGAWIAVRAGRSAGSPSLTCVDGDTPLHNLGVALWVRRADLVPVATRTVELPLPEGTSVTVRAGTPVGDARADGWRQVTTRLATFYAPVPTDAVGLSFSGWGAPRDERPSLERKLDAAAVLTLGGGERVVLQGDPNRALAGLENHDEGGRVRVTLDTRCFRLVATTWKGHVVDKPKPEKAAGGLGLLGALAAGRRYRIAGGATVRWPDGSEAGRRRNGVHTVSKPVKLGGMVCFDQVFGHAGPVAERTLRVCYDAKDVTETENVLQDVLTESAAP